MCPTEDIKDRFNNRFVPREENKMTVFHSNETGDCCGGVPLDYSQMTSEQQEKFKEELNKLLPLRKEERVMYPVDFENTTEGGIKNDSGKERWDLFPWDAAREITKVLTKGAQKYSGRNWEKGMSYSRVYAALQRHLTSWYQLREENDPEWGLSHLAHAGCCVVFLLALRMRVLAGGKVDRFDDRPTFTEEGLIKIAE